MGWLLFVISLFATIKQVKWEHSRPQVPHGAWDNTELKLQDALNGMDFETHLDLAMKGRYRIPSEKKCHVNKKGQEIIENTKLYEEDRLKMTYGNLTWSELETNRKFGKYNLSKREIIEKSRELLKEQIASARQTYEFYSDINPSKGNIVNYVNMNMDLLRGCTENANYIFNGLPEYTELKNEWNKLLELGGK